MGGAFSSQCVNFLIYSQCGPNINQDTSINQQNSQATSDFINTQNIGVKSIQSLKNTVSIKANSIKCSVLNIYQTGDAITYVNIQDSQKFTGDLQNEIKQQINQWMKTNETDITNFLGSLTAKQQQSINKNKITNLFTSIITTTVTESLTSSVQSQTTNENLTTLSLDGDLDGLLCNFSQSTAVDFYSYNVYQQILNATLKNQEATDIMEKYYSWKKSQQEGIFGSIGSIGWIIGGIILLLLLVGLGYAYYRSRQNRAEEYNGDYDENDDENQDEEE